MQFEGLINLPTWGYIGITLLLTHITIASVTIFLHRHQAHQALTLHPLVSHFFRIWLWLTTGMVTKEWVAVHRKHHAKCETEDDPHSPQRLGISKVLLAGVMLYRAEIRNNDTVEEYGHGTPDDWLERHIYSRFPFLGIATMLTIDVLLFGFIGLAIYAVQMLWIPFWAAGVINGIGHYFGYRNFETQDASRNIIPVGVLIGGEELHNNHHAYAQSAKLSNKWWEIDIGWIYIRALELLGFAQVKRTAPKTHIATGKLSVDMDTVRAIVRNRFHILKLYGRDVIRPVLRVERRNANIHVHKLFRHVRRFMIREDIHLDGHDRETLDEALRHSHTLNTVYQFKQQLKILWTSSSNEQTKRVESLKAWCTDAERTGIQALQEFARVLQGYSMQAV